MLNPEDHIDGGNDCTSRQKSEKYGETTRTFFPVDSSITNSSDTELSDVKLPRAGGDAAWGITTDTPNKDQK